METLPAVIFGGFNL